MAEGRSRAAWDHTAALLSMLANVNRDPKGRGYSPAEFHPYHQRTDREPDIRCKDGNESMAVLAKWSGVKRNPPKTVPE